MKIGNVEIANDLLLAPMAGYTDVGFRKICRDFGCALSYTEMVSAKALIYDSQKTKDLLLTAENEIPKAVQIFGNDANIMAEVCKNELLDKFDIIDINMGCPAPKIVKNGEGSFLLTDIKKATNIVDSCVKATNKPITVKMRLGYNDDNVALDFAKSFESVGASAVTIHGRTKNQMYSGKANYNEIAKIKQQLTIPVIANGDVVDKTSYNKIKAETNADFVMIGRGAVGNPFIFSEILSREYKKDKFYCINEHIDILKKYYNERFIVLNMRKHIASYFKNEKVANNKKLEFMKMESIDEVLEFCKNIFN